MEKRKLRTRTYEEKFEILKHIVKPLLLSGLTRGYILIQIINLRPFLTLACLYFYSWRRGWRLTSVVLRLESILKLNV